LGEGRTSYEMTLFPVEHNVPRRIFFYARLNHKGKHQE